MNYIKSKDFVLDKLEEDNAFVIFILYGLIFEKIRPFKIVFSF